MKRNGKLAVVLFSIACVATGIIACRAGSKPGENNAKQPADSIAVVKVVVAQVNERPFDLWGSYSADLRGFEDANLSAPGQGGRVGSVRAVGTRVNKGDALCDIDSERYSIVLEAAVAQLTLAKGDLDRARINVENGSIGKAALDGANLAYQNARMLQVTARRAYEDCRCQAPFDGVIVSRTIEKYQTITPGMSTVRLSRLDRLEAVVAIPETEAFAYHEGMQTLFTLLQNPGVVFEGKLSSIDRSVDQKSRTVAAKVDITNKDGILKPGMVGRARILRESLDHAIVIPSTALLHLENGLAVMVAENGVARKRIVTPGSDVADSMLITDGLRQGDQLIVTGGFQLNDGTKVTY